LTVIAENVVGLRFFYRKAYPHKDNFETFPFYKHKLRRFLAENTGRVCWLVGNTAQIRKAYLVFYQELTEDVLKLLREPLKNGGFFVGEAPSIGDLIQAWKGKILYAVGQLKLSTVTIGEPVRLLSPLEEEYSKYFPLEIDPTTVYVNIQVNCIHAEYRGRPNHVYCRLDGCLTHFKCCETCKHQKPSASSTQPFLSFEQKTLPTYILHFKSVHQTPDGKTVETIKTSPLNPNINETFFLTPETIKIFSAQKEGGESYG